MYVNYTFILIFLLKKLHRTLKLSLSLLLPLWNCPVCRSVGRNFQKGRPVHIIFLLEHLLFHFSFFSLSLSHTQTNTLSLSLCGEYNHHNSVIECNRERHLFPLLLAMYTFKRGRGAVAKDSWKGYWGIWCNFYAKDDERGERGGRGGGEMDE